MIKKQELPLIFESMAILMGTIIGGGIFVLPYVNIKSGIWATNFWLFFLCIIMCLLHLIFGEIILKTDQEMKLPGYAGFYLGKIFKKFLNFVSIFSIAFSLLIYLLLANKFIQVLMGDNFINIKPYTFLIIWMILNVFLFLKMANTSKLNFILTILLIILMLVLSYLCFTKINILKIFDSSVITNFWYVSYGVIFFAIDGLVAMPMMFNFLRHKKASKQVYKKSVIWSYLSIFIIFFLFMNSISLLSGKQTTINAINGLLPFLGKNILIVGALIGLLAVVTSYIIIIHYFRDMLICDINCKKWVSIFVSIFLPLIFLFMNINKIDDLMSLVGGVMGGIIAIVVLLMYQKVKSIKQNVSPYNLNLSNWLIFVIGSICFIGSISQIVLRILNLS